MRSMDTYTGRVPAGAGEMRIKGMTYEEFIKQYRMRAHEELGYDL